MTGLVSEQSSVVRVVGARQDDLDPCRRQTLGVGLVGADAIEALDAVGEGIDDDRHLGRSELIGHEPSLGCSANDQLQAELLCERQDALDV